MKFLAALQLLTAIPLPSRREFRPEELERSAAKLYEERLHNRPYRRHYRTYGYRGMHTDATSVDFVEHVIAPLLMTPQAAGEAVSTGPSPDLPTAERPER